MKWLVPRDPDISPETHVREKLTGRGTPNLPTKIPSTKESCLKLAGMLPRGLGIVSLEVKTMLESNPLKSRILVLYGDWPHSLRQVLSFEAYIICPSLALFSQLDVLSTYYMAVRHHTACLVLMAYFLLHGRA